MEIRFKVVRTPLVLDHLCMCGLLRAWASPACVTGLSRRAGVSSCWTFAVAGWKRAVMAADSLEITMFKLTIWTLRTYLRTMWVFIVMRFFAGHVCGTQQSWSEDCRVSSALLCLSLIPWLASLRPFRRLCF